MEKRYGFRPDPKSFRELAPGVWRGDEFAPSICLPIDTPVDRANKTLIIPLPQ